MQFCPALQYKSAGEHLCDLKKSEGPMTPMFRLRGTANMGFAEICRDVAAKLATYKILRRKTWSASTQQTRPVPAHQLETGKSMINSFQSGLAPGSRT